MRSQEEIQEFMTALSVERRELRDDIMNILWHMRSVGREEAWAMCWDERVDAKKLIKERVALVEKTGLALL